jgi:hypothetical protein
MYIDDRFPSFNLYTPRLPVDARLVQILLLLSVVSSKLQVVIKRSRNSELSPVLRQELEVVKRAKDTIIQSVLKRSVLYYSSGPDRQQLHQ